MSYNTETVNVQYLNQSFLDKVDSGMTKEAGVAMSAFVRQKLREDGFTRKVLPFQPITAAELDRQLTEEPTVICEKEPDSIAATLPFLGRSEIRYWTTPRYPVTFQKLASADFRKSKFELLTYRTDIRTVLQENSIKDIQKQEDVGFYGNIRTITAAQSNDYAISGGFSKANFLAGVKKLIQKQLPVGCVLMTQSLYSDLLAFPSTDVGSPAASSLWMGEASLTSPFGYNIITTNKNDILADNEMLVFAPPQYLGQAYSLQEATVFLKAEKEMLEWSVYESIGVGLGNVNAVVRCTF
jgi:hypothetical protein